MSADFPQDLTATKVRRLAESARLRMVSMDVGGAAPLASGMMEIIEPVPGVSISAGRFQGQRAYSAQVFAEPGLSIEVRVAGRSRSQESEPPGRATAMEEGRVLVSGQARASLWAVESEIQAAFATVSIRYDEAFLDQIAAQAPEIAGWAQGCVKAQVNQLAAQSVTIRAYAEQVLALAGETRSEKKLALHALALQLLAEAWRISTGGPTRRAGADRLVEFVAAQVRRDPKVGLTLAHLARTCRISESGLKQRFKAQTGRSLGAFILDQRMAIAASMLADGVTVSACAQTLGYHSAEAFSRAFKRHYSRTPKSIRSV